MRYLISIKYDGSKFYGFQRLKNYNTVQKKIEEALSIISKSAVKIKGAGRTDRGVHALDQKATFDLNVNISEDHLQMALNSLVKPYIYVKDVKVVDNNFHARFNVVKKEYVYKINVGEYNPLWEDYTWQINRKIDIDLMKKCAKIFIGVHNFQNFVGGWRNNYEAIIYDISFQEKNEILEIKLVGKSFYRYMVRNIVGAIMDVEAHKVKIEDVREALVNPQINKRFKTAVPNGLYLNKIIYEGC